MMVNLTSKLQPHGGVGISIGGFIIFFFFFSPFQVEVVGRKVFGIFFYYKGFWNKQNHPMPTLWCGGHWYYYYQKKHPKANQQKGRSKY